MACVLRDALGSMMCCQSTSVFSLLFRMYNSYSSATGKGSNISYTLPIFTTPHLFLRFAGVVSDLHMFGRFASGVQSETQFDATII